MKRAQLAIGLPYREVDLPMNPDSIKFDDKESVDKLVYQVEDITGEQFVMDHINTFLYDTKMNEMIN